MALGGHLHPDRRLTLRQLNTVLVEKMFVFILYTITKQITAGRIKRDSCGSRARISESESDLRTVLSLLECLAGLTLTSLAGHS